MALGDKIELLRVRLEEMLGEQTFIEGVLCVTCDVMVMRNTPRIRHTLVQHTSHLTPHTSHLTPHSSHLTPHSSHLTPYTPHTSHTPHPTAAYLAIQSRALDSAVFDILGQKTSALRLLQVL